MPLTALCHCFPTDPFSHSCRIINYRGLLLFCGPDNLSQQAQKQQNVKWLSNHRKPFYQKNSYNSSSWSICLINVMIVKPESLLSISGDLAWQRQQAIALSHTDFKLMMPFFFYEKDVTVRISLFDIYCDIIITALSILMQVCIHTDPTLVTIVPVNVLALEQG